MKRTLHEATDKLLDIMQSEQFSEQFERARELQQADTPDVYILTDHAKELLTRELPFVSFKIPNLETLFGIPFESYPTLQQALTRVAELNQDGKRVALIAD